MVLVRGLGGGSLLFLLRQVSAFPIERCGLRRLQKPSRGGRATMCAASAASLTPKRSRRENVGRAKAVQRQEREPWAALLSASNPTALSGLPDLSQPFAVLGIETSCDDTAAAVVRSDGTVLGEAIVSQHDIHERWGGVMPSLARDAHEAAIDRVVQAALAEAGMSSPAQVDAIAVTVGPGLEICLRIGCERAKSMALRHQLPFVAVHHLEAHTLLARMGVEDMLSSPGAATKAGALDYPFLALLVSGGHSQFLLCEGLGQYSVLGGTIDDAIGEAFDKAARLLGLSAVGGGGGAPAGKGGGGAAVELLARGGNPLAVKLPVPMQQRKDCDLSFSGLKNAFRLACERCRAAAGLGPEDTLPERDAADLAASFQNVAIRHLEDRLKRVLALCEERQPVRAMAIVGGVAANLEVRRRLLAVCSSRSEPLRLVAPPPRLCTDNGVMAAWAGVERLRAGISHAPQGQEVFARFPIGGEQSSCG